MNPAVEIARILLERQIERMRTAGAAETLARDAAPTAENTIDQGRQPEDHTPNRPTRQTEGRK